MAFGNIYAIEDLLDMYVAGLLESIQGSPSQFYIDYFTAALDQLARHARSTTNIQRRSITNKTNFRSSRTDATLLTTAPNIKTVTRTIHDNLQERT